MKKPINYELKFNGVSCAGCVIAIEKEIGNKFGIIVDMVWWF